MVINRIDLDSAEALEVVGFKLKERALTTYNQFRRDKGKNATFFSFILVLRDFLIPTTSKDLLCVGDELPIGSVSWLGPNWVHVQV